MKKLQILSMFTLGLLMAFSTISCSNDSTDSTAVTPAVTNDGSGNSTDLKVFDLRNKVAGSTARSLSARAASENAAEKVYSTNTPFIYENKVGITEDEIKQILKFEAVEEGQEYKGVKVTYHLPNSLSNAGLDAIQIRYVDGNGNATTTMQLENVWYEAGSGTAAQKADKVFYFPLVQPNSSVTLNGLISYKKTQSGNSLDFSAQYKLDTKTGLGTIDDLPKNYGTDYTHVSVSNLTGKISNVIAPVEKSMKKKMILWYTDDFDNRWNNDKREWVSAITQEITSESGEFDIDYTNAYKVKPNSSRKYLFLQFFYSYRVDGYSNAEFKTPALDSPLVEKSTIVYKSEFKDDPLNKKGEWGINNSINVSEYTPVSETELSFKIKSMEKNKEQYNVITYSKYLKANTKYMLSADQKSPDITTALFYPKSYRKSGDTSDTSIIQDNSNGIPKFYFTTSAANYYVINFDINCFATASDTLFKITNFKLEEVTE